MKKILFLSAMLLFATFATETSANTKVTTSTANLMQNEKEVKGVVRDENGETLPGVVIQIVGTTTAAITDIDGVFTIKVKQGDNLKATCIGFEDNEFIYEGQANLNIILKEKASELEGVSVVAFSTQKKESVLGSITTVKPAELKVPSSNLTTSFSGRVAGLISYQRSGEPGQDNASFFIRGITTFGAEAKKDPLILIDGIELSTSDLARLNTDDIASFSIFKDATATALYGARGANGVISVTTKEGIEGSAKVSVRLENSFSSAVSEVDLADPITYMRMHNEALKTRNPLALPYYSQEKIFMTERGTNPVIFPAVDWQDAMFKDVISNQRANLSISGGGGVVRYYVAANFTQDNGNMVVDDRNDFNSNINLQKINFRSNININLSKTTELSFRMTSNFDNYTGPISSGTAMYNNVIQANPVFFQPYYEPTEEYQHVNHIMFGNYGGGDYMNPYAESLYGYKDYSINKTIVQLQLEQDMDPWIEGLKFRAMVNFDRYSTYEVTRSYKPFYYELNNYNLLDNTYSLDLLNPTEGAEWIDYNQSSPFVDSSIYGEATADYNRTFNDKHNLNVLLVGTARQYKVGSASDLQTSLPNRNLGLSGRIAYNYDSRYFIEGNFGYNGSERFSEDKRWGFFPSIGGAWILTNEEALSGLDRFLNTLKLKATYGMVGNDAIGSANDRFYYLSKVTIGSAAGVNWGTQASYNPGGVTIDRYANNDIGWEIAYKLNAGIEFETKGGLTGNLEYFTETRENILLSRVLPTTMGIAQDVDANLGKAASKGFDAELNYQKFFNSGLWVQAMGTFTFARSEILEWEEPDYSSTPWLSKVGNSIGQSYGYIAERLFVDEYEIANSPTQFGEVLPGDIKYTDVNGDGRITELDKVPIGLPTTPEINYGFGFSAGYKGFDFSVFFQGSGNQSFWLDLGMISPFADTNADDGKIGNNAVLQSIADSYWSESNPDLYAMWPRLSTSYNSNNTQPSTWFMQDASFLRLKSAEIGYSIPDKALRKIRLSNLRFYVSGTNLLTWSKFKLWDPEMAGNGLGYPVQRVINIGLTLGF